MPKPWREIAGSLPYSSLQSAHTTGAVIPVALRVGSPLPNKARVKIPARPVPALEVLPVEAAAQENLSTTTDGVMAVNAVADADPAPQFRTVVFIEATQYGNSGLVWRVQVWHLTVFNGAAEKNARVPAAHAT